MSLLSTIEGWIQKDEQWIANFLVNAKSDFTIFEANAAAFWQWLSAHSIEIATDAQTATSLFNKVAAEVGPNVLPASVVAAVNQANAEVGVLTTAVNAANASSASGGSVVDAGIAAYSAAKSAQVSVGQALAAMVNAAPSSKPAS
jgi:hypothetical protein